MTGHDMLHDISDLHLLERVRPSEHLDSLRLAADPAFPLLALWLELCQDYDLDEVAQVWQGAAAIRGEGWPTRPEGTS
jgi:hypothetical protein